MRGKRREPEGKMRESEKRKLRGKMKGTEGKK